jgi:hypothetical protein
VCCVISIKLKSVIHLHSMPLKWWPKNTLLRIKYCDELRDFLIISIHKQALQLRSLSTILFSAKIQRIRDIFWRFLRVWCPFSKRPMNEKLLEKKISEKQINECRKEEN